jgi:hypothetical protein
LTVAVRARAPERLRTRTGRTATSWKRWAALYLVGAVLVLALEHLWRGASYWNFSEGVYLATARALADGTGLYTDVVAAQPPPLFFLGAGLLSLAESLLFVRGALAVTTVATGALVAVIVARLTGRPLAAVAAGLAALVMPWTIREHATLTPDPLAAAPLLGAALLAARPGSRAAAAGGVLAAVAASLKLAFLLPAAAVWLAARRRLPFLAGALAAGGALAAVSLLAWGSALWDNLVRAQGETGFQFGALPGLIGQTTWNLGPLLVLAGLAVYTRERARDPALFRAVLALLAGSLGLMLTFLKGGTYLNTLVAVEPVVVTLAAAGLIWFFEDRAVLAARRRLATAVVALACALMAAQSISLLAAPESPLAFGNPFLSRAPGHELSESEVRFAERAARACPGDVPYSGSPFIAFVADRPVPGGQPDRFIVSEADVHAEFRRAVALDVPRCPYPRIGGLPEGGNAGALVK